MSNSVINTGLSNNRAGLTSRGDVLTAKEPMVSGIGIGRARRVSNSGCVKVNFFKAIAGRIGMGGVNIDTKAISMSGLRLRGMGMRGGAGARGGARAVVDKLASKLK